MRRGQVVCRKVAGRRPFCERSVSESVRRRRGRKELGNDILPLDAQFRQNRIRCAGQRRIHHLPSNIWEEETCARVDGPESLCGPDGTNGPVPALVTGLLVARTPHALPNGDRPNNLNRRLAATTNWFDKLVILSDFSRGGICAVIAISSQILTEERVSL